MSTFTAIVRSIVGQAFVTSPEGIKRLLVEGDHLFTGDQVDTGTAGAVSLELADGRTLDLGRNTQWSAATPDTSTDLAEANTQALPSIDELQQAIAAGADPTTDLEATAAGPTAAGVGGALGGGHSFVMLDATAGRVDPSIGFPTAGIGSSALTAQYFVGGQSDDGANTVRASTLSLSATPTITEAGGMLVYTATLTQAPLTDLTVTLSNGAVIVIPAGQLTGTVNVPLAPHDSAYIDPTQIDVSVAATTGGGGIFVTPTGPATTHVIDTIDTTTVTLTAGPTITEGGQITYTAILTNPAQTPVTVNLSNGAVITIDTGKTTGSVDVATPANDVYKNGSTVTTTITEANGGNFENLMPNPAPAVTTITDSIDNTGLTLTANDTITEGNSITYTATLTNPAHTPITVILSNGTVITIDAGNTTGSKDVSTPINDVYKNGSTVTTTITEASGGNFENLVTNPAPAVTNIVDSIDTTTVTLTANGTITEGNSITYTATLTNPAHTPVTVNLSNGAVITIDPGITTGSVDVATPANDVYKNGSTVTTTITDASGGNFENLVPNPAPAVTTITDSIDNTGLTLTANSTITEGNSITYTATLTNPAQTPVTVSLSNGAVITIDPGKTTGSVDVATPANDVYKNGSTVTTTITDASGGNFENLVTNPVPAVTTIVDSIDNTGLTLTANGTITEGSSITYTATLSNPAQTPVTVNLSNGAVITVDPGKTTGSVDVATPANDVYKNGSTVTTTITDASGGNFENLVPNPAPAVTTITDSIDNTGLSLTATPSVNEGGQITYTATLTNVAGTAMVVTLSNGAHININAGSASGSVNFAAPKDDVYLDAGQVNANITSSTGGNFEKLTIDPSSVVTNITDTIDTSTVTLTATTNVNEGGTVTYTATVTSLITGLPIVTGSPVTVTLTNIEPNPNGEPNPNPNPITITIAVGESSGSITTHAPNDALIGHTPLIYSIATLSGGNYENLVAAPTSVSTQVTDTVDITQLSLSATPSVAEGGQITYTATLTNAAGTAMTVTLSNGAVIHIDAGSSTGSQVVDLPDDVYLDAGKLQATISTATGGNLESLAIDRTPASTNVSDTIDATHVSLTATPTVTEGGQITYTATLTHHAFTAVAVTLSNGAVINIDAGQTTGSVVIDTPKDDVYINANQVQATITTAVGGNFENLVIDIPAAVTSITDTPDKSTVTLFATNNVDESGTVTYTATVTSPVTGSPVTVILANGGPITIAVGESSGSITTTAPNDAWIGHAPVTNSIVSVSGGNYENLAVADQAPVSTNVLDTIDSTGLSLIATQSVAEGDQITYTATLTNPAGTAMTVTLSNNAVIHIDAGQTTGSVTDAGQVQATITTTTGGNFENLVIHNTSAVNGIGDTPETATVKLFATDNVNEGGAVTYTATVTSPVTGSPVVVTLANGELITIAVGESSGSITTNAPNDVWVGHTPVTNSIASVSGGNYQNLMTDSTPVSTHVIDTVDSTHLSLTATDSVAEGGQITYTATLTNLADTAVTVTLSNGAVINIEAGSSTGSQVIDAPKDDAYVDNSKVQATITTATGGNFENLALDYTPAVTNVTDTAQTVTTTNVSLTASPTVAEGGQIIYTATLSNPAGTPVAVTLSNGAVISIDADKTTGSVTVYAPQNDVYLDAGQVQATITGTTGGNFESLVKSSTPAVTSVTDTVDTSTVKLFATDNVNEGGTVTYTATVTSPVTGSPVIVTLANGGPITIAVGESSGSVTTTASNDALTGHAPLINSISGVSGGNYENLVADPTTVSTNVTDSVDITTLTLSATPSVAEGGQITYTATLSHAAGTAMVVTLSNGTPITIDAGSTSGSVNIVTHADNPYLDAGKVQAAITTTTGGDFENLVTNKTAVSTSVTDTVDITNLTLNATPSVAEGGQITYTATLTNLAGTAMTVTLSNGAVVHIDAGKNSGSVNFTIPNDVYLDASTLNAHISSTTGGNFESLVTDSTPAITSVTDKIDTTEASITGSFSVTEGDIASYTVSLTHAAQTEVTLNIAYSGTAVDGSDFTGVYAVKIPAGASSATFNVATIDDKITEDTESLVIKIDSVSGGNFENLAISTTNGSVSTSIIDNDAPPVLTLDANGSSGAASTNYNVTFTEATQGQGISISDTDLKVTDSYSTLLTGATIVLTNSQPGDALKLSAGIEGISANVDSKDGAITLTLSGNATLADYMQQIENVTFTNTSDDPSTTPRTITVSVTDGNHYSDIATTTINVIPIDHGPISVDAPITDQSAAAVPLNAVVTEPTNVVMIVADSQEITVGSTGNDIVLSPHLKLDGVSADGYQVLQKFVAQQIGADVNTVGTHDVQHYANENHTSIVISGPSDASQLISSEANGIFLGQGGNHSPHGNNGNDLLLGGTGTDTVSVGAGNDSLVGGAGADSFIWSVAGKGNDAIKDFKSNEGGRIDLHDLLHGESGSTIDNYLKVTTVDNVSSLQATSEAKLNATGGVANADVTIKAGDNHWSHASINSLIAGSDPTIKIDHNHS
ncbi:MAG: lapA [Pseudomonas sp.]|nr:lapA [Pseudomonas sp.]